MHEGSFEAGYAGVDHGVAGGRVDACAAAARLRKRYAYRGAKAVFDRLFAIAVIVAFSWLFLLIAIAVKAENPRDPVIFKQKRVSRMGSDGSLDFFDLYKFRTMSADAEVRLNSLRDLNEKTGPVFKIKDDPRITRVGRLLRKLSLDELPQFINVLKGEISVVGPRPALVSEVECYNARERQRLLVKAGMTCYWQTRPNRDAITFDEWVNLDLLYIQKCSLWSDFKLVIQTIGVVLLAQGS